MQGFFWISRMAEIVLTDSLKKALLIIRDHSPSRPREFAYMMWKDSPKWKNKVKAGNNGVAKGGGMPLAAGGYLGKLQSKGLIIIIINDTGCSYILTKKAHDLLSSNLIDISSQ